MSTANSWVTIGAVLGGLAVAMGAFGAHGVDSYFVKKYRGRTHTVLGREIPTAQKFLNDYKTAAAYQMYHALALIAVGLLCRGGTSRSLRVAGYCFLGGIVLFSGGLYVYTLADLRFFGMIPAPIGGSLFLVGWAALAAGACPCGGVRVPENVRVTVSRQSKEPSGSSSAG